MSRPSGKAARKYVGAFFSSMYGVCIVSGDKKPNGAAVSTASVPTSESDNQLSLSDLFDKQQRLQKINVFEAFLKQKDWKDVEVKFPGGEGEDGYKLRLNDPMVTDETPERYVVGFKVKQRESENPLVGRQQSVATGEKKLDGKGFLSFYRESHENECDAIEIRMEPCEEDDLAKTLSKQKKNEAANSQKELVEVAANDVKRIVYDARERITGIITPMLKKNYQIDNSRSKNKTKNCHSWTYAEKVLEDLKYLLNFAEVKSDAEKEKLKHFKGMIGRKLAQVQQSRQKKETLAGRNVKKHKKDEITLINCAANHSSNSSEECPHNAAIRIELWLPRDSVYREWSVTDMYNVDIVAPSSSDGKIQINFSRQNTEARIPFSGTIPLTKTVKQFLSERRGLKGVAAKSNTSNKSNTINSSSELADSSEVTNPEISKKPKPNVPDPEIRKNPEPGEHKDLYSRVKEFFSLLTPLQGSGLALGAVTFLAGIVTACVSSVRRLFFSKRKDDKPDESATASGNSNSAPEESTASDVIVKNQGRMTHPSGKFTPSKIGRGPLSESLSVGNVNEETALLSVMQPDESNDETYDSRSEIWLAAMWGGCGLFVVVIMTLIGGIFRRAKSNQNTVEHGASSIPRIIITSVDSRNSPTVLSFRDERPTVLDSREPEAYPMSRSENPMSTWSIRENPSSENPMCRDGHEDLTSRNGNPMATKEFEKKSETTEVGQSEVGQEKDFAPEYTTAPKYTAKYTGTAIFENID